MTDTDTEKHDFEPCPFCGNSQHIYYSMVPHHDNYPEFHVTCEKCHARMIGFSEGDVVRKWNTRV